MQAQTLIVAANIFVILVTLLLFGYIHYTHYNAKSKTWNWINAMAAVTIALTLNSSVPQFFLFGRTAEQCAFLHHWAGSFSNITNGLSRMFFVLRSNQVLFSPTKRQVLVGRLLVAVLVVLITAGTISYNAAVEAVIVQSSGVCAVQINPNLALFLSIVLPFIIVTIVNIRFVLMILSISKEVSSTESVHSKAKVRLLRTTCVMSVATLIVFIFEIAFLLELVPISDPVLSTCILMLIQSFYACSTAWPTIFIQVRKIFGGPRSSVMLPRGTLQSKSQKTNEAV